MVQVATPEEALDVFSNWLDDPEKCAAAGRSALAFAARWGGATDRMMTILEELWQTAQKTESPTY